ncbi:hypothetical protein M885DRAFT_540173 [Pelagophyceae sp. CCMP2097]|nr:hypothetical protein M885DRAFT_540173 [Pelagophyceae sp. CCMP2097]
MAALVDARVRAFGVEVVGGLHRSGAAAVRRLAVSRPRVAGRVSLVHADVTRDSRWARDADVAIVNWTCFDAGLVQKLTAAAIGGMAVGSVLVTFATAIQSAAFVVTHKMRLETAWGTATCFVHRRLSAAAERSRLCGGAAAGAFDGDQAIRTQPTEPSESMDSMTNHGDFDGAENASTDDNDDDDSGDDSGDYGGGDYGGGDDGDTSDASDASSAAWPRDDRPTVLLSPNGRALRSRGAGGTPSSPFDAQLLKRRRPSVRAPVSADEPPSPPRRPLAAGPASPPPRGAASACSSPHDSALLRRKGGAAAVDFRASAAPAAHHGPSSPHDAALRRRKARQTGL